MADLSEDTASRKWSCNKGTTRRDFSLTPRPFSPQLALTSPLNDDDKQKADKEEKEEDEEEEEQEEDEEEVNVNVSYKYKQV